MIQLKNRIFVPLMTTLIVAIASCLAGCADRDDRPEPKDLDPSLQQAGEALNRAQAAMERAGVVIDFSDIGTLGNLTQILPDPLELAQPERQAAIQEAIGAMYDVLDALGDLVPKAAAAPANPAQEASEISESDRALIHIHLAYLYILNAMGEVTRAGAGNDQIPGTPDDLFTIKKDLVDPNQDPNDPAALLTYKFELLPEGENRQKAIEGQPPEKVLEGFTAQQRQSALDALSLLLGAKFSATLANGTTQTPNINRDICRQDALFHLEQSLDVALMIAPDLGDAMDEFNDVIAEGIVEELLGKTGESGEIQKWGF